MDMFIQNSTIHRAIIPDKLIISIYQLIKVDCHNKLSDLQFSGIFWGHIIPVGVLSFCPYWHENIIYFWCFIMFKPSNKRIFNWKLNWKNCKQNWQCWIFPHHTTNTHGEFQKVTSHRWVFPCIDSCFEKCVRINEWTHNHLRKYGKQNTIFNTIKEWRAHRACLVEPRFIQPKEKNTQRPNLNKKCVAENF